MKSKTDAIIHETTGKQNRPATSSPTIQSSVAKSWGIYLPNGGVGRGRRAEPWFRVVPCAERTRTTSRGAGEDEAGDDELVSPGVPCASCPCGDDLG
jgi:hypothetical protein